MILNMNILNREINHNEIYLSLKENGAWASNDLIKKDYINKLLLDFPNTINFNDNNNEQSIR